MKYDTIKEVRIAKTFNEILEIQKYNDLHDELGRFAPKGSAGVRKRIIYPL